MIEVVQQIKIQSFIKAISILHAINSHQILQLKTKQVLKQSFNMFECRQSKNVFLQADLKFESMLDEKQSVLTGFNHQESIERKRQKVSTKHLKKNISAILIKQLNQTYHPFYHIKQSFMMIMQMRYRIRLDQCGEITQKLKDKIYDEISRDIDFYSEFISKGCYIYQKWIIKYTKIKQQKYLAYLKKNILDSLFHGHSFHKILFPILKQLNESYIKKICSNIKQNISVQKFCIDKDLQIEGTFVRSSMLLGDFDRASNPKKILELLEKLKLQICNDIDLYHQLFKTDKNYKIDGDNFLSILSFLLCKLKNKMLEIYCQIFFLSIVFGDNANIIFESASYMITSIQASFDYLSSPQFIQHIS